MGLTKQQLEALNNSSFPNNNSGYITPAILRNYNSESVANTVNQDAYSTDSASVDSRLDSLESFSSSLDVNFASQAEFNSFTQSTNNSLSSLSSSVGLLQTFSGSEYKNDSASFSNRINNVTIDTSSLVTTSSFNSYTASQNFKNTTFATTGSNVFVGNQTISGSLVLTGDITASKLLVQIETASVIYSSGSNQLGDSLSDVQTLSGSVKVNGTFETTGSITATGVIASSNNINSNEYFYGKGLKANSPIQNNLELESVGSGSVIINTLGNGLIITGSVTASNDITLAGKLLVDNTASLQFPLEVQDGGIKQTSTNGGWIFYNEQSNGGLRRNDTAALELLAQSASLTVRNTNGNVVISGSTLTLNEVDFINFSSSVDSRLDTIPATGSFATTGSNTFKGIETLQDDGGNTTAITPYSGSLLFVANTFASTSLNYITASTNKVNIILKDNNVSGAFLLTGSGNIITNPNTASVGFISYLGNNNYSNNSATQFSSSMTTLGTVNNNILNAGLVYFRGGSAVTGTQIFNGNIVNNTNFFFGNLLGTLTFDKAVGGYNVQSNIVNSAPTIAANVNNLASSFTLIRNYINSNLTIAMSSSVFVTNGNYFNSSGTYTNQYFSSSIGSGSVTIARNIINGSTNNITITGSQPAGTANGPQFGDSMILGTNNTVVSNATNADVVSSNANHTAISTLIAGHNNIVSASSAVALNNFGGAFIGRYNDISGNKAKTSQTIFSVGTGNSTTRKTGFLIDSGSNTYVEGSLNVSGSSALTGSLNVNGNTTITGSLQVTGSTLEIAPSGTLIYGDKTVIKFYESVTGYEQARSRFDKDGISIFQYQNQGHVFGFRYTADQLNEYSGSQFKTALTNDGVAYDDYISYLSASISGSGGSIPGIELTDGKAIYQNKPLLQKQRAYFDQDVIIAGVGVGTSLTVTGSTNFSELGNTSLANYSSSVGTHISTLATTGSNTFNGNQIISGSVTIANSNGNDLYVHGHKQFNAGEFWSTITQSGSAGVSGSITFNNSGSVYGVSIVSSSQVTMENAGVYNIQFSAQIETSAGSDTAYVWFKKNGSNIADSATKVVLANNTSQVMTVNILDTAVANDYYELGYQFTNGNATILAEAASGNIPGIPSVILTVTQAR